MGWYQTQRHGDTQQANMLQKTFFIFSIFSVAALALDSAVQPIQSSERDIVQLVSNDPDLSTLVVKQRRSRCKNWTSHGGLRSSSSSVKRTQRISKRAKRVWRRRTLMSCNN